MSVNIPIVVTSRLTGGIVSEGDMIESFRGEKATFVRVSRAAVPGKSGKIIVRWFGEENAREYYDSAFNLSVVGMLPCGCVLSMMSDCVHVEIGDVSSGILRESAD